MLDVTGQNQQGTALIAGLRAVDCDVHPRNPGPEDLLPHADAYWRDMMPYRGIAKLVLTSNPETATSDEVRDVADLQARLLDPLKLDAAILNLVNGTQAVYDPYLAKGLCEATNRWIAAEWLDRDPRLRASLLVPFQHPEAAAEEIRRYAQDRRFLQIQAIGAGENPLGARHYWPIYKAAAEAGFALQIHPGTAYRHAPTQLGFPSFLVEERVQYTQGIACQMVSLLSQGVFGEYPEMKLVLAESGVTWLFSVIWRLAKEWRGIRVEVPWVKDSPEVLIGRHVRLTTRPFDAMPDPEDGQTLLDCLGGPDLLLYSSDFPHLYAEGLWPAALPEAHAPAICRANALATYPRLDLPT